MRAPWILLPWFLATSVPLLTQAETGLASGTGFVIDTAGHLLTAAHVVAGCRGVTAKVGGRELPVTIVSTDVQNDLGLLKISAGAVTTSLPLRDGTRIRLGESVFAFGFPLQGVMTSSINMTPGSVSALAGLGDDVRLLQFTAPIQPGNSGGPLVDSSGNVMGVVTSRLSPQWTMKNVGTLPENVNFAVKASIIRDFLDSQNVEYRAQGLGVTIPSTTIAEKISGAVLPLQCTGDGEADHGSGLSNTRTDEPAPKTPSLRETLDWLAEKIPLASSHYVYTRSGNAAFDSLMNSMGGEKDVNIRTTPVRFDSCTVIFDLMEVNVMEKFPGLPIVITTRSTVPLGAMTGGEVVKNSLLLSGSGKKMDTWIVALDATSAVMLDETHESLHNSTKSELRKSATMAFFEESMAERVLEAFKHAADLCRGKEPF